MKFSEDYLSYLAGGKFDTMAHLPLYAKEDVAKHKMLRITCLTELVKDKRIIHVGCCDHLPLIAEKRKNNAWVHDILTRQSAQCIGVDIDVEAVRYVREEEKVDNVYLCDVAAPLENQNLGELEGILKESQWDYLVLGEVLEHIGNPVQFLEGIHRNFKGKAKEIIITVPNAFYESNLYRVFRNTEPINTDHRFWFTPYTLSKVAYDAGFLPIELQYAWAGGPRRTFNLLRFLFRRMNPVSRTCLVLRAAFR